jgi:hypothetical protein
MGNRPKLPKKTLLNCPVIGRSHEARVRFECPTVYRAKEGYWSINHLLTLPT